MYFPFELNSPFLTTSRPRLVVVSDSQYKEYQKERAEKELLVLTSKKNRYEAAIAELDSEIKQIQTEHNLLPAANDTTTTTNT